MILYQAITNYHILELILYRNIFHKNEEVILILPDFITNKLPFYEDLERDGFFDKVYLFPYWEKRVEFEEDESSIEKTFKEITGLDIEYFDEIYLACAQYCLTKYVLNKNLKFFNVEDGKGSLANYKVAIESITKMDYQLGSWAEKNEILSGKNKNIIKNVCNISSQKQELEVDNIIDFNVTEVLKHTEIAYIDKIKKFFKAPENIYIGEKAAVLLTQHFANMRLMTKSGQIHMYQLVIDFYANNYNIVIKRHPDDWLKYEEYAPNVQQIDNLFPMELLPYISAEGSFDTAITINSCSVANINDFIPKVIFCGERFIYNYKTIIRIYYILKLIEKNPHKEIIFYNVYENLVENLIKYSDIDLKNTKITFANEIEELEVDINNEVTVVLGDGICIDTYNKLFVELDKANCEIFLLDKYFNDDVTEKFITFKVEKTKTKEPIIDDLDDEYIYVKTNLDYSNVQLSKTLEQTGIKTRLIIEN